MKYENIVPAVFLSRPNRFIANVEIDGIQQVCHVKNTGRCKELLTPGAQIFVQRCDLAARKTALDLIAVKKGGRIVNMDSQAPNKIFSEWVQNGGLFQNTALIKPEQTFGDSRLDFYLEGDGRKIWAEVKGVTLEERGIARFPDAPTQRGIKHLRELIKCVHAGFEACIVFIIQMDGVKYFEPNWATHAEFGETLREASAAGVRIIALDCAVCADTITAKDTVEVKI